MEVISTIEELPQFAKKISVELLKNDPFCLWLEGDLGSGKTTFTRTILYELGLDQKVPVQSPTFTFVNEYNIGAEAFVHCDFYRVESVASMDEFDLTMDRQLRGLFIEWPFTDPLGFAPTHKIKIQMVDESRRSLSFVKL